MIQAQHTQKKLVLGGDLNHIYREIDASARHNLIL